MINDKISVQGISRLLSTATPIEVLETVNSTNTYLKRKVSDFLPDGTTVIALRQTAGRGRFTRKFHSPEECGIYMSILLRPQIPTSEVTLITAAAAVAVCEAIEACSDKSTQIKWVNDVLIDSKKVCGILTEGVINPQSGKFDGVIVGIGINVYEPLGGFPDDIKDIASAIFSKKEAGLRNKLAAQIINRLIKYSENLGKKDFFEDYKNRSIVIGKPITVISGDCKLSATALSIDDKCRLLVEFSDKTQKHLDSGEISIKL